MTPVFVGICGGTGSGKTTVAERILAGLPPGRAALIQHDSYYRDRSHLTPEQRRCINFDEPDALENDLLVNDLKELRAGRPINCPRYDFSAHTRSAISTLISPHEVILVEGILLFALPALRDVFDLRLFVETPDDLRLLRRIKRDLTERGRVLADIEEQYLSTVRPMHERHVAPTRHFAHLIVPDGGDNAKALDVIVGRLLNPFR